MKKYDFNMKDVSFKEYFVRFFIVGLIASIIILLPSLYFLNIYQVQLNNDPAFINDKNSSDIIHLLNVLKIGLILVWLIITTSVYLFLRQRNMITYIKKIRDIMLQGIEKNPSVAVLTDSQGNIIYVNETFEKVTGYSYDEVYGKTPRILKSNVMPKEAYEELWKTILSGKSWEGEFYNRCKDGSHYWAEARISAILNKKGQIEHFFALQNDVTKTKMLMERVNELATKDPLTGAYNRNIYNSQLPEEQLDKLDFGHFSSALMIDIDFFKKVNDNYGHQVGDFVLEGLAKVIHENIRDYDRLIRYGGEEFLLLLGDSDHNKTKRLAERIRKTIEDYHFKTDEIDISITISIGVSLIKPTDADIEEVIGRADKALYYAKHNGRNQVSCYEKIKNL
ncbi:MAG: diguanylate cyclase [Vallitaleaceae bacterium]|jgi:diguanylate cyclase (GGDEF)-like protein/PAS domain S-box-containing protein|nr:diguanylate cyclase [Vallitaleaceae bacterium]